MTLTFEYDPASVKMKQLAKYATQELKVSAGHTDRHTGTGPIAISRPLNCSLSKQQ